MKNLLYPLSIFFLIGFHLSCVNSTQSNTEVVKRTFSEQQEVLIKDGWILKESPIKNGELSSRYGVKPQYGIQDNFFDIEMGKGGDIVVKIINLENDKCIRYIYVNEESSTTINCIPNGKYYLKIAYGKDWIEKEEEPFTKGKFSSNCHYEKSTDIFDFGRKNSTQTINYTLKINVQNNGILNNFNTTQITEEEFYY